MIYIASDHAGFYLKEKLKKFLVKKKYEFQDLGPIKYNKIDDYPDSGKKVSKKVSENKKSFGILICSSGHGMNITANKFIGVRASICLSKESAILSREHNNLNVLCIPSRFVNENKMKEIVTAWISTKFSNAKRHARRLKKIKRIENEVASCV